MDAIDDQIVWILTEDGRTSVTTIADRLGVSKSTISSRLAELQRRGVIRGIHADPNFEALGLTIQALVFVRLRAQMKEHVSDYARKVISVPAVASAFHLTGGDDFVIHVTCTSPRHLREVVETQLAAHPAVASTRTQLAYDWARGDANMGHLEGWDEVRESDPGYRSAFGF